MLRIIGRRFFLPSFPRRMPVILVTDPSYVRDPSEYQLNITDHDEDLNSRFSVRVPVTDRLFAEIGSRSSHIVASKESDESFYRFGVELDYLKDYEYIGWHGSDSGMTCVIQEDPFSDNEIIPPVDYTEFTLSTLQDPEAESNQEEFPLYKWFGRVPEAASSARVYACGKDENGYYDGLLIRSGEDELIDNENE